jgi:hypothetical protein
MCSNTLAQQRCAASSTLFRSGGQGPQIFPPLRVFCRTVVVFLNRSSFLNTISYLYMLLYLLEFFWAEKYHGNVAIYHDL